MLMTANDLDGASETLAVQILADQLVDIGRIAVGDEKAREHPQCAQNLVLGVENAKMHAEAMRVLHPVAVTRVQIVHSDDRITADLQRVMAQQGNRRRSIQDEKLVIEVEMTDHVDVLAQDVARRAIPARIYNEDVEASVPDRFCRLRRSCIAGRHSGPFGLRLRLGRAFENARQPPPPKPKGAKPISRKPHSAASATSSTASKKPLCRNCNSSRYRRSASWAATFRIGHTPFTNAPSAATLLFSTEAAIPKTSVNTPAMQRMLGTRISPQLTRTLRCRSEAMSSNSQSLSSPGSMNTTCAVSVAIDVARRSEIEKLGFFKAMASLMPSPTKQTLRPPFCSFST